TLNVRRFEGLCRAIIAAGLDDLEYTVQAMTSAIANHGETPAPLMRHAGFRYVFLGIEDNLEEDLGVLPPEAQNPRRGDATGGGTGGRNSFNTGNEILARKQDVGGGRADRRHPEGPRRVDQSQSGLRPPVRRRSLHPAPDAVPENADDEDVPGSGAHHQRAAR